MAKIVFFSCTATSTGCLLSHECLPYRETHHHPYKQQIVNYLTLKVSFFLTLLLLAEKEIMFFNAFYASAAKRD